MEEQSRSSSVRAFGEGRIAETEDETFGFSVFQYFVKSFPGIDFAEIQLHRKIRRFKKAEA
jgi:hypothetical protein